jgi:hypothetical protein
MAKKVAGNGNGRGRERSNDPARDFPLRDTIEDASGKERTFLISYRSSGINFTVTAEEVGRNGLGYQFTAYSETSPYNALGLLRERMYRSLATRHITRAAGGYRMLHDTLRGRITVDEAGALVVVVDGVPLTMGDLQEILASHEGFQVRLEIADPGEDISR